jgi:hypothetical protein
MDAIVPELNKNSARSIHSPEAERAHKFRERAKSVTIGRPEFKLTQKKIPKKSDLIKALETLTEDECQEEKVFSDDLNPRKLNYLVDKQYNDLQGYQPLYNRNNNNDDDIESGNNNSSIRRKVSEDITHSTVPENFERMNSFNQFPTTPASRQNSFYFAKPSSSRDIMVVDSASIA